MADVPIYVALITAAAGVIGAGIPQVSLVFRDVRQGDRDRRDRYDERVRQASLSLLRAASDLRTLVANAQAHRGESIAEWLADVDRHAAEAKLNATDVGLLVRDERAVAAEAVAQAAADVATAAAKNTNLSLGDVIRPPYFRELDDQVDHFRRLIIAAAVR